jgi:amidase
MTVTRLGAFAPAIKLLRAMREQRISSIELLQWQIHRIERYNPSLNAIVSWDYESAYRSARKADMMRAAGADGPLLGLPLTVKDCIDVKGLLSTAGLPQYAEHRAEVDACLVARLRAAGAVIFGKTNVPPLAQDWQTDNPVFGRTNNPWDLARTSGGSTGGGAAAVTAGLTPLEFGSDISGSIRLPAAFCGVYGHKPSETVVPRSGHFPEYPLPNAGSIMGARGPLARCADDLELALDVVAGPDIGEDAAWQLRIPPARSDRLRDYRVAVLPRLDWLPVDAEIMAALDNLAVRLGRSGLTVKEASPEYLGDLRQHYQLYNALLSATLFARQSDSERKQLAARLRAFGDPFLSAFASGLEASVADYIRWQRWREDYREAFRRFFRDWDILLTPVTIVPAFPHLSVEWMEGRLDVSGEPVPYARLGFHASIATLSGHPATAFPFGLTKAGLPIGLQAIGPYLEDRTPIRFTSLIHREFGGWQPPPGYDTEEL